MSPLYCEFNVHKTIPLEGFIKAVFFYLIFPLKLPVTLSQASQMEAGHNKKIFAMKDTQLWKDTKPLQTYF